MAVLPLKKAKGLAEAMEKHGVSGAIAMKAPADPSADEELADEEVEDYDASELDLCIDDLGEAFASGDKEAFKSALRDLVDCVRQEDEIQDEQLGE